MTLTWVPQLVPVPPGAPRGGLNCGCAVGATCVIHATGGIDRPNAADVRALCVNADGSPDRAGGTHLRQVADALLRGWGVRMSVVTPERFPVFRARMTADRRLAASVSLRYGAFIGTPAYASRSGFRGNHQVAVRWVGGTLPWEMTDPLADGNGVPHAPVRISDALLRKAAGDLVLNAHLDKRLGSGLIYVGYVEGPKLAPPAPPKHSVVFDPGAFFVYSVQGGVAIARTSQAFVKRTSAPCAAPEPIHYPTSTSATRSLVRIAAGALEGRWVEPGRSHVRMVTL